MSGTATIEVPKGLDKLSADEQKLMDSMRADEAPTPEPEPTPRAAPEPAATPEPEIEDDPTVVEPGQSKTVPHQAFHAERERRKAAEERARVVETEKAADMARLQERINLITGIAQVATQQPAAAPVAEEVPDVNTDPVGHFQAVAAELKRTVEEQGAILQGFTQRSQQNNQIMELRNWGAAQEQAFEIQEPSYRAAMDHLGVSRRAQLTAIGVTDPAEQMRIIGSDITNVAARARQEGANFAARLYDLAQQFGFKKEAVASNGAVIPPIDAAAADLIEQKTAARDNATTLSAVNGGGPGPRLSVAEIAKMTEKQFDAFTTKLKEGDPEAFRNLMGA